MKLFLALACIGVCAFATLETRAAVTVINHYRMGENDPGAVSDGVATNTLDSVGTNHLLTVNAPVYSTNVSAEAATGLGSAFSMNFSSGGARYASGALLSNVTDNFGLE